MDPDLVDTVQAHVRRQQRLDALCAATLRALSARREVHARGPHWYAGDSPLPSFAPHLHPQAQAQFHAHGAMQTQAALAEPRRALDASAQAHAAKRPGAASPMASQHAWPQHLASLPDAATVVSFRGAADGIALRLRFSDTQLHRQLRPERAMARRVFDVLEQYRAESLVPAQWPGVRSNMSARFKAWSHAFISARLHESAQGLLLLTVAQIGRARVTGEPVDEALEDMLEATRFGLASRIGYALAALRRSRHAQALYAQHALAIAQVVADLADGASQADKADKAALNDKDEEDAWLQIWVDFEAGEESGFASALDARDAQPDAIHHYRVFSTRYDREVRTTDLVRAAQLQELRHQLDESVRTSGVSAARLARSLQSLLALPQIDGWDNAQDSGYVDGRRLAQLVAKPDEHRVFRLPRQAPRADVALTLLLDCSGSMKQHMDKLAPLVDVLTRALDMAGVATEVLGYTTNTWNGGRVIRDWRRAAKPAQPGRLNELCHMVFKDSGQTWRRSKPGLAALLKADIFRECVDGEALRWAAERLRAQDTKRRLLVVFSDGSPMDGATVLANDPHYLDRDLQHSARLLEREAEISLFAVGLGLDLSAYFARSTVLDLQNQTVAQAMGDVLRLLTRAGRT